MLNGTGWLPVSICALLFHLTACTSDNREAIARNHLLQEVTGQSGGAITIIQFAKTNGYDQEFGGTKMYVLEWSADISVTKDLWKQGNALAGYWNDFAVLSHEPGPLENLGMAGSTFFEEGTAVRLSGKCQFRKTDNGWRVEDYVVQTSQVLPRQPKTLEGTVTGYDGTRYWSGYTMVADGKQYSFIAEYNDGQGTNPTVEGGECCKPGMRVRVTYIPHKAQAELEVIGLEVKHVVILP